MQIVIHAIFALELALLLTHEMDAVHKKEWKMFFVLKDMAEERGYCFFTILHIPLYTAILMLLLSDYVRIGFYIMDVFLIAHLLVHVLFKKHPANNLNGRLSKSLIYSAVFFLRLRIWRYTALLFRSSM